MKLDDLVKRINELIQLTDPILATAHSGTYGDYVDTALFKGFRTASLSFLLNIYGDNHPFYTEFNEHVKNASPSVVRIGKEILIAVKNEIAGGWRITVKGIISAEIFSDFIDMANYLLSEGYKDAAAVMIGSTLEEHLRQLCTKYNIDPFQIKNDKSVPKKADLINAELSAKNVYNKLDQKMITANLDLRNKAAHGKYDEYTKEQVTLMYQSIIDFMTRISL